MHGPYSNRARATQQSTKLPLAKQLAVLDRRYVYAPDWEACREARECVKRQTSSTLHRPGKAGEAGFEKRNLAEIVAWRQKVVAMYLRRSSGKTRCLALCKDGAIFMGAERGDAINLVSPHRSQLGTWQGGDRAEKLYLPAGESSSDWTLNERISCTQLYGRRPQVAVPILQIGRAQIQACGVWVPMGDVAHMRGDRPRGAEAA